MDLAALRYGVTGPIASINTPFLRNGDIDYQGLGNFIDAAFSAGARAVLFTPGDSLYPVLSEGEIAELTRFAGQRVAGRGLFIAAAGFWWTRQAVEFARVAREAGAGALVVAPPDRGTTVDDLVAYYRAISAELPVFLLSAALAPLGLKGALQTVDRLLEEVPGVAGFKEDYTPRFAQAACLRAAGRWAIFAGGAKQTHLDMAPYGCDGYMSVYITYRPEVAFGYWRAVSENRLSDAAAVIRDYDLPLFDNLYSAYPAGGDAAQHGVLEVAGVCQRWRRPPLASLTDADMDKLRAFLATLPPFTLDRS